MAKTEKRLIVEWTKTAEIQFYEILTYWINRNKSTSYSEKLAKITWEKIEFIVAHPFSAMASKFPKIRIASVRHLALCIK
ncbi:type II toxin-antitoxin system RelE/ParE family toxin [Pedobacter cryophilus]|uniref:Type II toxin-antitoxin system RelE/ParE family toxin n=1 Tax=Pedobacter cryophilus TaxID=2571271 RepID=A0A4U1C082_9SPHI|nr:type II toxin-antitoxin system RelE/ParE family toxin [Pedobacter cryophilus]TKB98958.1 type II toxin-antitoxin system RelE/ParE family toxin [Pedobacter cryophilus]